MNPEKEIEERFPDEWDPPLSPLWVALRADDQASACALLRSGVHDPNQLGPYDGAPGGSGPALGYALAWRLDDVVDALLEVGAFANDQVGGPSGSPVMGLAKSERAVQSMVRAGADINGVHPTNGRSVLSMLIQHQADEGAIRAAIDAGADVHHRNAWGTTPIFGVRSVQVAQLLVDAGADPTAADPGGEQALHYAAMLGDVDVVEFLLMHGCDPHRRRSGRGLTAAEFARERNQSAAAVAIERWIDDHPQLENR